jgi:hypothetical protein
VVASVHNIKQNEERSKQVKAFWLPNQIEGSGVRGWRVEWQITIFVSYEIKHMAQYVSQWMAC